MLCNGKWNLTVPFVLTLPQPGRQQAILTKEPTQQRSQQQAKQTNTPQQRQWNQTCVWTPSKNVRRATHRGGCQGRDCYDIFFTFAQTVFKILQIFTGPQGGRNNFRHGWQRGWKHSTRVVSLTQGDSTTHRGYCGQKCLPGYYQHTQQQDATQDWTNVAPDGPPTSFLNYELANTKHSNIYNLEHGHIFFKLTQYIYSHLQPEDLVIPPV